MVHTRPIRRRVRHSFILLEQHLTSAAALPTRSAAERGVDRCSASAFNALTVDAMVLTYRVQLEVWRRSLFISTLLTHPSTMGSQRRERRRAALKGEHRCSACVLNGQCTCSRCNCAHIQPRPARVMMPLSTHLCASRRIPRTNPPRAERYAAAALSQHMHMHICSIRGQAVRELL